MPSLNMKYVGDVLVSLRCKDDNGDVKEMMSVTMIHSKQPAVSIAARLWSHSELRKLPYRTALDWTSKGMYLWYMGDMLVGMYELSDDGTTFTDVYLDVESSPITFKEYVKTKLDFTRAAKQRGLSFFVRSVYQMLCSKRKEVV